MEYLELLNNKTDQAKIAKVKRRRYKYWTNTAVKSEGVDLETFERLWEQSWKFTETRLDLAAADAAGERSDGEAPRRNRTKTSPRKSALSVVAAKRSRGGDSSRVAVPKDNKNEGDAASTDTPLLENESAAATTTTTTGGANLSDKRSPPSPSRDAARKAIGSSLGGNAAAAAAAAAAPDEEELARVIYAELVQAERVEGAHLEDLFTQARARWRERFELSEAFWRKIADALSAELGYSGVALDWVSSTTTADGGGGTLDMSTWDTVEVLRVGLVEEGESYGD